MAKIPGDPPIDINLSPKPGSILWLEYVTRTRTYAVLWIQQ